METNHTREDSTSNCNLNTYKIVIERITCKIQMAIM